MDPTNPQQTSAPPHPTAHQDLSPVTFALKQHPGRFQNARVLGPLNVLPIAGVGSTPLFHTAGLPTFPSVLTDATSGTVISATPAAHDYTDALLELERKNQLNQQRSRELLPQKLTHDTPGPPPTTASRDASLASADRFEILAYTPGRRPGVAPVRRNVNADPAKTGSGNGSPGLEPARSGQSSMKIVENPPDLDQWRQKLFALEEPVVMTTEEFETYFPWVDNIYSHRSTQPYKRKTSLTRYYDCRMVGRPSGTRKSDDPNKKKRKRAVRERNLCDVKIKITEYQPGSASELQTAEGLGGRNLEEALARVGEGAFRVVRRISAAGGGGTNGGGAEGKPPAVHRHDLRKSDEIKRSSAHRWLMEREREAKRSQKPSPWKPTGSAAATAKSHAGEAELKFYSACFCPFSQRVWIALEAKRFEYQYCETYPLRKPKPRPLLEANPRGLVPAIRVKDWACSESSIILEYLEDDDSTVPLHPSDARLKANCRLWIDFINTKIVPAFYSVLSAADELARKHAMDKLQRDVSQLVQDAADEKSGPYFLGKDMCLVDVHLAPFALRLSRLQPFKDWPLPTPETRWKTWVEALEASASVKSTTSGTALYMQTMEDLVKGFQGFQGMMD
ncbi:hypothetical protein VTI74DRAFT_9693 [Chaetomium olivicolor]